MPFEEEDPEAKLRPQRFGGKQETLDDLAQVVEQQPNVRALCTYDDCGKSAVSKGLCSSHGGGARCNVEGCDKLATRKGHCGAHATEYGDSNGAEPKKKARYQRKVCKEPGCENMEYGNANGYCTEHGGGPKRCVAAEGCSRVAIFQGMCLRHANAFCGDRTAMTVSTIANDYEVGYDPSAPSAPEVKPKKVRTHVKRCRIDSCEKHVVIIGYCMTHARENSDLIPDKYRCQHTEYQDGPVCGTVCIRNQRCYEHTVHVRCRVESCKKHSVFQGYCKAHGVVHAYTPSAGLERE